MPNFKTNNMTTTLTLHWEYEHPDHENGIQGGYILTDITDGKNQIHLSPKLEELLQQELNPNQQ